MKSLIQALGLLFVLTMSSAAFAQLDATSAVLLRGSSKSTDASELDSSKYKIRAPESKKDDGKDDEIEEKPGTFIPSPVPMQPSKPKLMPAPVKAPPPPTPLPTPQTENTSSPSAPTTTPAISEQMRQLFLGDEESALAEYRKQVHPQDPRNNVVGITIAPAYFYSASQSEYSFRRYHSDGPGFTLGANFWASPFFGAHAQYFGSMSSSVRSGGINSVPEDVQSFEGGIRFRKHFGYSRKSPILSWGVDYKDDTTKISNTAMTIVGRRSSGLNVTAEAILPTNNIYAHTVQFDIAPRLKHSELATGVTARSGTKSQTTAVGLGVGGRWTLDRRNQLFWKAQYNVEKNLFDGPASQADPHTGNTPDGVGVTNTLAIFYFGLQWGS